MKFNHEALKELRESNSMSREDMIYNFRKNGLRVSSRTLARWECGQTSPDAKCLAFIADFFKKSPGYFFN